MELPPIPGGLRPDSLIVFPDTIPRISTFDGEWKTEEKDTTDDEVDDQVSKPDASFTDLALGEMLESEEKLLVGKDSLAWVAWQLRKNLLIATRKKGLKKFKDAFFGTHVIGWFLHAGFCQDTDEGAQLANDLLQRGYLKFCDRSLRGKPFLHEKSVVYQFTSLALVVTARVTLKDLLQTNTALSGYMKKYAEGKKVGGKWKVRYFCLSIATGALMYFYSPECVFPLSYVPLQQILFCTLTGKKGRTLTIVCWDRVLKLKAENVKEATIWQHAIEDALEPVVPPYRATPSPKTPPEHKEEWLQADSQTTPSSELFKIEQEFFKLLTPTASYYAKNPEFLRKVSGEFPSIGEVMEIIVDVLLNPVVPPQIAVDPSTLICCVSKSTTYLQDSKPRANAFKVLPDLFAPVRSTVNTSPTTHHRRTGSSGKVDRHNSVNGRRNSQVGGRGHARVFSAVIPGDLLTTTERMDTIRDIITGQLTKARSPPPAQRPSLSLPPSLALPEKEKPKTLEVSPHLAAFVKPRLPTSGSMRSRFGSAVEIKTDSLSRARNSSAFGSFTKVKDKASTWLDIEDGSNSSFVGNVVLSPAPFVETEWDPEDAKAGRAHVLGNIMASHRDFSEYIGEPQVLSSKNGIPMAWVYFQRFYHSNMPDIVQMGQEDHWKRNFIFDCDACVIASEKFAQFLSQRVGGKSFRLSHGNSILAVVVTEAQRFCIDLMEPQTKRYNVLGRTVVNPGAWVALLRCLQFANFDVRRHTLKDIYSCVISNADNAHSLLAIGDWPRLLLSLLSDLPVETISGGTTDGIDPSVQNVLLCMERIWLFVMSIISELLRITFFDALGPGDDARMSTFRERGAWMDFRTVFQKCMSIALVMSASEAPKNRLIVPRHIISSLLLAIRKRVVNQHYHLEGSHWGRLSFLSTFISNFTFSYVSIMQPLLDLPNLSNECRNSIQLAAKANPVAFSCLSSVRPLKPRFGSPTLAPKEFRNSLSRSPSRSPHAPLRLGEAGSPLQKRNSVSSFHSQSSHSASPTRRERSNDRTLSRTRTENFIAISHHGNESTATNEFAFRLLQREPGLNQFYHSSYDIHPFSELPQDRNLLRIFMQLLGEVGVFTDIGRKAVTKPEKKKQIHDFVSSTQDQVAYVRSTVEVNLPGSRQLNEGELEMFRDLQGQLCWMSDVYVFLGMISSRVLCLSHQERLAMVQAVQTTKDRDEVFRNRALGEKITVKRGEDPRFSLGAQHSWPLGEDSSVTEALLCDRDVRVPVSSWPRSFQFMMDSGDSKVGTPFAGEKGLEVLNQAVAEKMGRMEHSVEGRSSRSRETRVSQSSKSDVTPEPGGDISLPL